MKMPLFLFVVISIVATWGNLSKVAVGQGIVIDTIQEDPTITWSDREFWETGNGKPASDGWEFADGEIRLVKPRKGGNISRQRCRPTSNSLGNGKSPREPTAD